MTKREALNGKPYAGNPHVRFDEGEVAPAATPRRGSLLYNFSRKALMVACSLMLLLSAFAEGDGYVRLIANSDTTTGFAGENIWSETVEDPSTRDYLVSGKPVLKTASEEVVNAKSLTFGVIGGAKGTYFVYYPVSFMGSGGVIFANGLCHIRATSVYIGGKATFSSPASEPFIFHGGYRNKFLAFTNDVHAAESSGILVYSAVADGDSSNGPQPFALEFRGNAEDFCGSVVVTSQYTSAGTPVTASFVLSNKASYFGGSVTVERDAVFKPMIATSIDALTLRNGALLNLKAGEKLTVRTALKVEGGPVPVTLEGAPNQSVAELKRYDLIEMPADCECSVDDFQVKNNGSSNYTQPWLKMELSEDGTTKTLYALYHPVVKLTKDEENNFSATDPMGASSVTNGTFWSDEKPVHGGDFVYHIPKISGTTYFTLPYQAEAPYVFPAPAICFAGATALFLRSDENVVSNVFFRGGNEGVGIWGLRNNKNDMTLRSNEFFLDGQLTFYLRNEIAIRFAGPIKGSSSSTVTIWSMSGSTSACGGRAELNGDNSRFAGRIYVTANGSNNISFNKDHASLIVTKANNLGGKRAEFAYDALKLDRFGQLDVREDITLDEPSRGIFMSDRGRISVAEGKTMKVLQPLTFDGPAYKEAAGTLELGGDLRFLDPEGAVTESIPADASNRTFFVVGGFVKPISAYALDGLDVVFSNKTSKIETGLMLDMDPQDPVMKEKGICNIKSPHPFEFRDDDAHKKIPVRAVFGEEEVGNKCTFAVMTVKSGCESVFDRLEIVRPENFKSHKIILDTVADETAGTVTLKVTFKLYGSVFSVR